MVRHAEVGSALVNADEAAGVGTMDTTFTSLCCPRAAGALTKTLPMLIVSPL